MIYYKLKYLFKVFENSKILKENNVIYIYDILLMLSHGGSIILINLLRREIYFYFYDVTYKFVENFEWLTF